MGRLFKLGQVVITPNARDRLNPLDVITAISRHVQGDWGDLCEQDRQENEYSLDHDLRLVSVYEDQNHVKFWIITEADRSSTCILLPEDY